MLLDVAGSVRDIERAFGIKLNVYQHPTEQRQFYAPDTEPSVGVQTPILDVSGLNNYALPHRAGLKRPPPGRAPRPVSANDTGSGTNGGFMASDIRAAYVPGVTLTGAGQSVALVETDDGYYPSDITAYEQSNNLAHVVLTNVLVDWASGKPGSGRPLANGGSANAEISLDIEMVIAMAPGISQIIVYQVPTVVTVYGSSFIYVNDLLNRIATDNLAKQISSSFVWGNGIRGTTGADGTTDQIFQQMAAQGQSFFLASGDQGAFWADPQTGSASNHNDAPLLTSPYITIVGGTELTTTGPGGAWASETTWNNKTRGGTDTDSSSGAISSSYGIPFWQQGLDFSANGGSTTMRNIPDVAMLAHHVLFVYNNGQFARSDGTSVASPLWAGFMALVNQQAEARGQPPAGFVNPAIYAIGRSSNYTACFHDITTGNNTNSLYPTNFFAVPGYDLCTGWGTPTGQPLIDALASPDALAVTSGLGFTAANGPSGPFNITNQNFILTISGSGALQWSAGTTSVWLSVSSTSGTLAPAGASATVSITLNAVADTLPAGTSVAEVWF